jgi:hypothetical protein
MEFTTKSGIKVVMNPAGLDKAYKLKSLVEKALLKNGINLFDVLSKGELSYEDLFNLAMMIDSDVDVFDACFECMDKSIYNNIKITKDAFEDETARGDLYEVLFYCLKVNIYPFFKRLLSSLEINNIQAENGEVLKSI